MLCVELRGVFFLYIQHLLAVSVDLGPSNFTIHGSQTCNLIGVVFQCFEARGSHG